MVSLACKKLGITAPVAWQMTIAELALSMREPEDNWLRSEGNPAAQRLALLALDERIRMLQSLTWTEKAELAEWKSRLM